MCVVLVLAVCCLTTSRTTHISYGAHKCSHSEHSYLTDSVFLSFFFSFFAIFRSRILFCIFHHGWCMSCCRCQVRLHTTCSRLGGLRCCCTDYGHGIHSAFDFFFCWIAVSVSFAYILFTPQPNAEFPYADNCNVTAWIFYAEWRRCAPLVWGSVCVCGTVECVVVVSRCRERTGGARDTHSYSWGINCEFKKANWSDHCTLMNNRQWQISTVMWMRCISQAYANRRPNHTFVELCEFDLLYR